MTVVTKKQMKQMEQNALDFELTYYRLMENAGSAAAAYIRRTFQLGGLNVMVFCGRGNNGGDGLVAARKLSENGAQVVVALTDGQPAGSEAQAMLKMAELMELPIVEFGRDMDKIAAWLPQTDIIVDAVYGTGFHGELDEPHRKAFELINGAIAAVVSLDLPSGVECDSGRVAEGAVSADFTVAFDSLKPLHVLSSSSAQCGTMEALDIGIPPEAKEGISTYLSPLTGEAVFSHIPKRPSDSHKGSFGRLLVLAGSSRFRGAASLACLGALRCGAGVVRLASTEPVCTAVSALAPEATLLPLPEAPGGGIDPEGAKPALLEALSTATAVVAGCGLGDTPHTRGLISFLLKNARCPVLLDADGINALAGNIHELQGVSCPVLLTPHPGEMGRLLGVDTRAVELDRLRAAGEFALTAKVFLALKGHETLVASPAGEILINSTGNPGLARGGSGDILSGMTGAFLAQGLDPLWALACGVYLHGLAADRAAARRSVLGMLPSDLLDDLCGIFLEHGR